MAVAEPPESETDLVDLLLSRNGSRTLVTTFDGEPMQVKQVERTDLHSSAEWDHFADLGGIGLSADERYFFYSTEIATIDDVATRVRLYSRKSAKPATLSS